MNRSAGIDLLYWHRRDSLKTKAASATTIEIAGGELHLEDPAPFTVTHPVTAETASKDFARAIRWQVDATELKIKKKNNATEFIFVREDGMLLITNVAKVSATNIADHFKHYYEIYSNAAGKELTVEHQDITVFDCVPPTPGP